jgi:hypothetical protein
MTPRKILIVIAALQLSGCGTYNSWTPRKIEAATRYSCADGYFDCGLRTSNRSGEMGRSSRSSK